MYINMRFDLKSKSKIYVSCLLEEDLACEIDNGDL